MKRWSLDLSWLEVDFPITSFWLQIHNLSFLWCTKENIRKIGLTIGRVNDVDFTGDGTEPWKRFIRLNVDIPIDSPLIPGIFLPRLNREDLWVGIKYEKLADVCYNCGFIGHEHKGCSSESFRLRNPSGAMFLAAGPWLRAGNGDNPLGIFLSSDTDRFVVSNPINEGLNRPPPPISSTAASLPLPLDPVRDHSSVLIPSCDAWQRYNSTLTDGELSTTSKEDTSVSIGTKVSLFQVDVEELILSSGTLLAALLEPMIPAGPTSRDLYLIAPVTVSLKPTYSQTPFVPTSPSSAQLHDSDPPPNKTPSLCYDSPTIHQNPQITPLSLTTSSIPKSFTSSSAEIPTLSSSHQPHKRKIPKLNPEIFHKRPRHAEEGVESVFIDPATASLIPQSRLEQYLSHLSFNPGYSLPAKKLGKFHKLNHTHPHESTLFRSTNPSDVISSVSVNTAKEAGLIMLPPSP